ARETAETSPWRTIRVPAELDMPQIDITKRWLESVRVAEHTDFFDLVLRTFGVRIAPTGVKTWFVLYTLRGERRKRRLRLGSFPSLSVEQARLDAMAAIVVVGRGGDPKLVAETGGILFADLAKLYLERHAKPRKRSWKRDQQV